MEIREESGLKFGFPDENCKKYIYGSIVELPLLFAAEGSGFSGRMRR